jgi:DNA (cytosine-5)-methyltransferase 1
MRYGSVCSGIEAATVAWHPLGWEPVWFSEIEPFPCKVLKHHYPNVPNLGNMLHLSENEIYNNEPIDLLVGGTPCQSFSIAGLRAGLADQRGNLALEYCRILRTKRPRWFVWENVPGVLSSSKGLDFRSILSGFQECGYSFAWRILDAQFFGVPQRRRRIFVVGYFGNDWRPPAAVLFEPQSLRRDIKKSGKEGKEITGTLRSRADGRGIGPEEAASNQLIVTQAFGGNNTSGPIAVSTAMGAKKGFRQDFESDTFITQVFQYKQSSAGSMNPSDIAPTLHKGKNPAIFQQNSRDEVRFTGNNVVGALSAQPGIKQQSFLLSDSVRRLTPMECERLQGFPDQYTGIKGAKNSPRYSSIGNSMATKVMAWIGRRIDHVDKQMKNS